MSLDKAIRYKKEFRRSYKDRGKQQLSKEFDRTCRPHGGGRGKQECSWCKNGRLHKHLRREIVDED